MQQAALRKMSSERIQGRLMRAGVDEEKVYSMGRPELLEAMANVMLQAEMAAATAPTNSDVNTELRLQFEMMRMQLEQRDHEMRLQLEQRDREHAREMQLQRECRDGELKMQMQCDREAREEKLRRQIDREESLVAKTKQYGQAVQYALANMPTDVSELPAWFDMVDNV